MSTLLNSEFDYGRYPDDFDPRFPDSDGQPMADNTEQFNWIVKIKENLEILFASDPNVFVAGDLLWYPVESTEIPPRAPDTMVVFGRPKGRRGSYKQWREQGIPPQVVFEILSPSNRPQEIRQKLEFYQTYEVEEYYLYNPNQADPSQAYLQGWIRQGRVLVPILQMNGWISPRLGIRFVKQPDQEMEIYRPDGRRFLSPIELEIRAEQERVQTEQERQRAEQERQRAEQERQRAEQERQRAEQEKQRAEQEKQRAEQAEGSLRDLTQRLRSLDPEQLRRLGIDPDTLLFDDRNKTQS